VLFQATDVFGRVEVNGIVLSCGVYERVRVMTIEGVEKKGQMSDRASDKELYLQKRP
jgi:hypothetical protein